MTAGTDRKATVPGLACAGAGAAAETKTGVAAETAQRGAKAEGRRAGAKIEAAGSTDTFTFLFDCVGHTTEVCFIFSRFLYFIIEDSSVSEKDAQ